MHANVIALPSLDKLRSYVLKTLCQRDALDPAGIPLNESVLKRSGRPCGLLFHIQGPRLLQTHAVWAAEEDRLLFYDSTGVRFAETRLSEGPDPLKLAG